MHFLEVLDFSYIKYFFFLLQIVFTTHRSFSEEDKIVITTVKK